jgi:putative oxidoreductase
MKFLHLNFIPRSADVALLVLRIWAGGSMALLHGWDKVMNFAKYRSQFLDFMGLGQGTSLGLAVFAELVCSVLIVLGLFTRFAALVLGINMFVAFWIAHGHRLTGAQSGELPFVFLGAFVMLFLAGGGKFSVDAHIGAKG